MIDFNLLAAQYKSELLDRVMPFWMQNSIDKEFGGYFTCIERNGEVYDTDKFIWLQGREVWPLATLYNKVEKNIDEPTARLSLVNVKLIENKQH